ncbi:MAG: hypothetical protein K8T91_03665 [Planctomycetes bacterium]|nr:hypothetical protein [Planctomycetota bacterium]
MAMSIPLIAAALGGGVGWRTEGWLRWVGLSLLLAGGAAIIALAVQCVRPRMAVQDANLLVFLKLGAPLAIPLSIVECVFLGRPETQAALGQRNRMVSLVIRLAEAATEYKAREVKPSLGRWEDGYITIHGAWCEPLTLELAQRLNAKLRDAQRLQGEKMEA